MYMWQRILINAVLIILIVLLQFSLVSGLPGLLRNINLIIISVIFVLVLFGFRLAFIWSIAMGLLMDFYSFNIFNINLLSLIISMALSHFLLINFLTNRSLYAFLILGLTASLIYELLLFGFNIAIGFIYQHEIVISLGINFWLNKASGIVENLLLIGLGFYLLNLASKRLKPVFLFKRNINR